MNTPPRCLFPTDLDPLSRAAAPLAAEYARRLGAAVTVLRAVRAPIGPSLRSPTLAGPACVTETGEPAPADPDAQGSLLAAFTAEHFQGLDADHAVVHGSPAETITAYAAGHGVDLLILPTHAGGVLHRLIHGSVSKSILESAPCPVLMIPAEAVHG